MKALATQFDNKRLSSAVATPTCSSCCCCCCCLATSIASSTLLAQRIGKEGEKHQVFNRHLLTVLAALFVPIVGVLVYLGFWTINKLLRTCAEHSYHSLVGQESYTVCTNPGAGWIIPLLIIVPFLVLLYLYTRVHIKNPLKRAALVTALIAVAFTAELFGGAVLITTGVGGIVYLVLIPIVVGWITVWYHQHLGKEVVTETTPSIQPVYPAEQLIENSEEYAKEPEDSSQQNPPASGS